jgi:integrase
MPIVPLTDYLLSRQKTTDRRILRDRTLVGFCVRCNIKRRSFFVATTCKGQQVRVSIGHYPLINTGEAREIARGIIRQCREGAFNQLLKKPEQLPSIRTILPIYIKDKGLKPVSLKRYDSVMRTHFSDWYDLPLDELSGKAFVTHCHNFLQSQTVAVVNMGRAFIGAIIRYANAVHDLKLETPFSKFADAGLMRQKIQPKKRKLQKEDLPRWYEAVSKIPSMQRDGLMLLAITGLRRNEALMMKRSQVDFDKKIINIPDTKNGKAHSLPITPLMSEILIRRCDELKSGDSLFPKISVEHLAGMAIRVGAPDFMIHDLRKMLASVGQGLNINEPMLRRILNHSPSRSDTLNRHYIQIEMNQVLDSLLIIQNHISGLMQKQL